MPTRQQLESALANAHNSGNMQAAKQLANALKQDNYDSVQPETETIPTWMGTTRQALQGMTFGLSDEIASGLTAGIVAPMDENRSFGEIYSDSMADFKRERQGFKQENPVVSTVAELSGGILTGGGLTKQLYNKFTPKDASKLRKARDLFGIGAVEGGIYGAATSDDRVSGGVQGAAIGGPTALIAPPLLSLLGGTLKGAGNWVYQKLSDTPKKEVERALRITAEAEGLDADEVVKLMDELGPDATLMDLGENFRLLTKTQVAKVGPAKTKVKQFIDDRQKGQQGRLLDTIEETSGLSGKDFKGSINELSERMQKEADPLYKKAYETPFEVTPKIQAILKTPSGKKALKKAEEAFQDNAGAGFSGGNVEILDGVKIQLDDMISSAYSRGKPNEARRIKKLKKDLVAEVDVAVPEYAQARNVWEKGSNAKESAELGQNIFKNSPDDLADEIANMTDGEKRLFRMGGLRAVEDSLGNRGVSGDSGKFLSDKPNMKKRLGLLFEDDEAVEALQKQIDAESAYTQTKNIVRGGSQTHEYQESARNFDDIVSPNLSAAIARGDTVGAFGDVIKIISQNKMSPQAVSDLTNTLLDQGLSQKRILEIFTSKEATKAAGRNLGSEVADIIKFGTAPIGPLLMNKE